MVAPTEICRFQAAALSWRAVRRVGGAHGDGEAGDHVYGAQIPALPSGSAVRYHLTAVDAAGGVTRDPVAAPEVAYTYEVEAAAPVAAFTFSPSAPTILQTVSFADASTNAPTSWSWSFGDGATSTSQNPVHAYAAAGSFTVTLEGHLVELLNE